MENQLKNILLSNCTINAISDNINEQLINKLKDKHLAIRLDEATDCNKNGHLMCYVCFMDGINVTEELRSDIVHTRIAANC